MLERYTTKQLMILYLGSKTLIENGTEFEFTNHSGCPTDQFQAAMRLHQQNKPNIYNQLASLSSALKDRNFTKFKGWYDFSNWENFQHFVMKVYQNRQIRNSFSVN